MDCGCIKGSRTGAAPVIYVILFPVGVAWVSSCYVHNGVASIKNPRGAIPDDDGNHVMIRNEPDKKPYASPDRALSDAQPRDYNFAPPTTPTRILILSTTTIHPPRPIPPTQSRCGTSTPRNGCPFRTMVSSRLFLLLFEILGDWGIGDIVGDGRTVMKPHE